MPGYRAGTSIRPKGMEFFEAQETAGTETPGKTSAGRTILPWVLGFLLPALLGMLAASLSA